MSTIPIFFPSMLQKATTQIDTKMHIVAGSIVKTVLINPLKNKEAILRAFKEAKKAVFSSSAKERLKRSGHEFIAILDFDHNASLVVDAMEEAKKAVFSSSAKERLKRSGHEFLAILDFDHNASLVVDAMEEALKTVFSSHGKKRLIAAHAEMSFHPQSDIAFERWCCQYPLISSKIDQMTSRIWASLYAIESLAKVVVIQLSMLVDKYIKNTFLKEKHVALNSQLSSFCHSVYAIFNPQESKLHFRESKNA
ncbi:MAG: hypothetical protein ACRCU0_04410 [Candidatus Rhabdochlamydia sp.]